MRLIRRAGVATLGPALWQTCYLIQNATACRRREPLIIIIEPVWRARDSEETAGRQAFTANRCPPAETHLATSYQRSLRTDARPESRLRLRAFI
jgi:hypothetical protein